MDAIATVTNLPAPLAGAYRRGYSAYQQGRSRFTNPLAGAAWFAWDSGWIDARTENEGETE